MKPLKPFILKKKRYLSIKGANLKENLEKAISEFIGISGMSKAKLKFIKSGKNSAIVSLNRKMVDPVRASLCVFPEKITVERVSGTLKGLQK